MLGGAEARGAVVAQRALHRELLLRPGVLNIQRGRRRAIGSLEVRQPVGELVRHAVLEAIDELRIVGYRRDVGNQVRALIADFHAVRTGHIGGRRAPVVRIPVIVLIRGQAAIGEIRAVVGDRRLLRHRDQIEDAVGRQLAGPARVPVGKA